MLAAAHGHHHDSGLAGDHEHSGQVDTRTPVLVLASSATTVVTPFPLQEMTERLVALKDEPPDSLTRIFSVHCSMLL